MRRSEFLELQSQPPPVAPARAKTVSLLIAIVMLIAGLGVGAGATYFATRPAPATIGQNTICSSPFITNYSGCASICSSGKTLTIGMLLDLSSQLSDQGTRAKSVSVLAINDINSFLLS